MNALQTAVSMAKKHGADLKLLHVFDIDNTLLPEDNMNICSNPDIAIKSLSRLAASVKTGDGVNCGIAYISGHIPNAILQTAKSDNADMIIMGKNGNSGYREMYAGSNSYDVIKKSHCPVLLIPSGKMFESFTDILFPARPVISVFEKYELIRPIVMKNKATLHFLALRNPNYIEELHIISRLADILRNQSSSDLFNTTMSYYFKDNKFAFHLLDTIQKNEYPYDLLVISADVDNNVKDYCLGDYVQQLIHQSPIPVMVIRPKTKTASKTELLKILEDSYANGELYQEAPVH